MPKKIVYRSNESFASIREVASLWGKEVPPRHCAFFVGDSTEVWIPSEKPTKNWTTEASEDFQTIRESPNCVDSDERKKKLSENFDGTIKTRIVFWRAEVCRFVGVYKLDESDGDPGSRLWRRVALEVSVPA